ncbi:MAG: hypothetical protein AAF721_05705 [Myxococcota bacterium]
MSPRHVPWIAPLCFAAACAAPQDDARTRDGDLTGDYGAVIAEVVVEVADDGWPVIADQVFAQRGEHPTGESECIVHAGPTRCKVWLLRFEARGDVSLVADLCGERHREPFALDLGFVEDTFTLGAAVTLDATGMSCAAALPNGCEDDAFAEPALAITAVDPSGDPMNVYDVQVQHDDEAPTRADCMEGSARGCSEWASPHTEPGRYRATVHACGEAFSSPWVDVPADDFGCKAIAQEVTVMVGETACRYQSE